MCVCVCVCGCRYLEVEWEARKGSQRSFGKDVMKGSSTSAGQLQRLWSVHLAVCGKLHPGESRGWTGHSAH